MQPSAKYRYKRICCVAETYREHVDSQLGCNRPSMHTVNELDMSVKLSTGLQGVLASDNPAGGDHAVAQFFSAQLAVTGLPDPRL
jgi:hypothetical protein